MAILKIKDANGDWIEIPAIVGTPGKDGTVNGVNALTIKGGDGIDATMSGDTLTIKAKTVEEWTFTLEDDSTVTKKVVLV